MKDRYKVQPVILCGGQGSRLWPISTYKVPKQFISLGTKGTLLEETLRRISIISALCQEKGYIVKDPILVMNEIHQLPFMCNLQVVSEKYANDTAIAVFRTALEINKVEEDVILLVMPADHYVYQVDNFVRDIVSGINQVTNDNIVLYGINPTNPETKYGYIIPTEEGIKFKEKPNQELALSLIKQNALWNSGIFSSRLSTILECLYNSSHNLKQWIETPKEGKAASFDVAVLQEYNKIYAQDCSGWEWSDIGTWESFINVPEIQDEIKEKDNLIECQNTILLDRGTGNTVIIGCKDLLIVKNGQDLLIISNEKDYTSQLKEIVNRKGF